MRFVGQVPLRNALISSLLMGAGLLSSGGEARAEKAAAAPAILKLTFRQGGKVEVIRSWTRRELGAMKYSHLMARDSKGSTAEWSGVPIVDIINPLLESFPAARSAEVDLLVFKNGTGTQSILPRSFVNKYPLLLALKRDGKEIKEGGSITSVVPKADSREVRQELLPVDSYTVEGLIEIEMGNYRQQFPSVFLKNRADPKRMRGERLFVKTCMGCHGRNDWPMADAQSRKILGVGGTVPRHQGIAGMPDLKGPDQTGLDSYMDAVRRENPDLAAGLGRGNDET